MEVRLTAQFQLSAIELSAGFEVATLLLKARPRPVLLRNREGTGRLFELLAVQLDSSSELESVIVRATD
jgi:hypothetical protein